jgi:hypothetical protein
MSKLAGLALLLVVSCAYPKGPIEMADDKGRIDLGEDITAYAGFVPLSVCVREGDRYHSELVQLVQMGASWWNEWLSRAAGCPIFVVDLENQTHLFCDVMVESGALPAGVSGRLRGNWTERSDPPGRFVRGRVTLESVYFGLPRYHIGVMRHELGHALGLDDDPEGPSTQFGSVMSSPQPYRYAPTLADLQAIAATVTCDLE